MSEIDQYIAILKQNVTRLPLFLYFFREENDASQRLRFYQYRNQIASSCIMCLFSTYCARIMIMNDEALGPVGKDGAPVSMSM